MFNKCYETPTFIDSNFLLKVYLIILVNSYRQPPKFTKEIVIRKVTQNEYKELKNNYEQMLRQLRIFLRDVVGN